MPRPWYKDPWVWAGIGAAGVGFFALYTPAQDAVVDVFERGKKLSYGTFDEQLGIVLESPEDLRVAASGRFGQDIPADIYAAARMLRSESAKSGTLRVHVALNDLASFQYASTLFELLTYSTDPKRKGVYGAQYSPAVPPNYPAQNKRRYSTAQNPYEGDVNTAFQAWEMYQAGNDTSGGATKFLDISSMGGVQSGTGSFEAKNAEWVADGYTPFTLPEFGSDLVLYRKG